MASPGASVVPGDESPHRKSAGLTPDEFVTLYREHYRVFWCVAAAILGRPADSDDCVQEAAITALDQLDRFQQGTSFGAWMSQIVRYTALNARRRERRRTTKSLGTPSEGGIEVEARRPPIDLSPPVTSAGEVLFDQDSFDDALVHALDDLDETPRICLLLRVVLGLPYREIAQQIGIPEGTAMSHVHRSRKALRASLAPARRTEP